MILDKSNYGKNGFYWFFGIVENRMDPLNLGRVQIRCFGWHSENRTEVPVSALPWATTTTPITSASVSGIGTSPTGLVEGSMVFGFFVDGIDAQMPHVIGSVPSIPHAAANPQIGFNDPRTDTSTFPKNSTFPVFVDEPDTNRLARNESIAETIVPLKQGNLDTATTADGDTVTEPITAYDAQFPFNHVRETESGHIQEFDDTPGAERIHTFHRMGTFSEIGPSGNVVEKVVADKYEVVETDSVEHVKANKHLIVDEGATIKVNDDFVIKVVSGDYRIELLSGEVNITGPVVITGDVSVTGTISATVDVTAGPISLLTHYHTGVTTGPGTSGPPTPTPPP